MIRNDGYQIYNSWAHSTKLQALYRRRCRREEPEMTCAAQAAELIAPLSQSGNKILDVGCGSGYFYHSLRDREIPLTYFGIDATPNLIEIGQQELSKFGLPKSRLKVLRAEDLIGTSDFILSMNFLTYLDNFHAPLERLLDMAKTAVILRESLSDNARYAFVVDDKLDPGINLSVHINTYNQSEFYKFIRSRGFNVQEYTDRRTSGQPENFLGQPHHWKFLVATRQKND